MTRDKLIARIVAIADERPNVSIGHVVEHELPELRAQAEAMPAQEPVAWMYQHEETGNVNFRPHNERWVDHRRYVEIPLYASPPDLAARVEELEAALRNLLNDTQHSEHHCGDEACPVSIARAVLAKETQ